jgi:hypothetical protein
VNNENQESNSTSAGRDPVVTDKELISRLKNVSEDLGQPIAQAKEISGEDAPGEIPLSNQQVRNRMGALAEEGTVGQTKVGRPYVWWIPDEDLEAGIVDLTDLNDSIDFNEIDPEKVPTDIAREIGETNVEAWKPPNYWESYIEEAEEFQSASSAFIILGIGTAVIPILVNQLSPYSEQIQLGSGLFLLAGLMIGLLTALLMGYGYIGKFLSERTRLPTDFEEPPTNQLKERARSVIKSDS